jgi:predicted ATPase
MMNRFESIHIQGYRRLLDVELSLHPLVVMIGANGSGKTSFLEAWSLLASASSGASSGSGELSKKISELGGITDIITRDKADRISFDISMGVPNFHPLDYHLEIENQGQFYKIGKETLTQVRKDAKSPFKHIDSYGADIHYYDLVNDKLLRPNWEHNPLETSLAQVPKMFQQPENLRRNLASSTFYGALRVTPKSSVRLPQQLHPATLPGVDGEDLVSCLYYLRETDHDRFEVLEDTLRAAFHDFERLDFPPVAAGVLAMTWKDKNYSRPMYMHQLSEGTLRFLWLSALLQSRDLTAITLLDEPEVSLHPELLSLLADLMREASKRTQLIVATHSDRLIRFLKPEEVLAADVENGETKLTWGDSMDLGHWLADYSLDEVWQMGRMGGRA